MLSSINKVSTSIFSMRESATGFFSLSEENEQLMAENLELIERSKLSFEKVDRDYALINDTLFQRRYTFQYANVINSTKAELKNHITLDKGSIHGIEPRMGVLSGMSLVGRVDMVTDNYSLVVPVISLDFVVSARLAQSGYFGRLTWEGDDFRMAILKEIPKEAIITLGDAVVTRGAGSLFPSDISIGVVDRVELDEDGNFYDVYVSLDVDMSKLNRVMLIKDLHRGELDSLSNKIEMQ
jgi:rod shape-determining protein MreC